MAKPELHKLRRVLCTIRVETRFFKGFRIRLRGDKNDVHKERLPSAVDDAASVILESKRKEAFVRKNAPEEKESSLSGLTIFVLAVFLVVACGVILL